MNHQYSTLPPVGGNDSNDSPLVTVGIPTYNRPYSFRNTLNCMVQQTYKNLEIIISDNCSSSSNREKLLEIVNEFSSNDSRIKCYLQESNIVSLNFPFLVEKAHGDFFMWAADDDWWDSDFIERCLVGLQSHKGCVAAFANCYNVDEQGKLVRSFPNLPLGERTFKSLFSFCLQHESKGKSNPIYSLFKMQVLRDILARKYLSPFTPHADAALVAEAMMRGGIYFVPECCFYKTLPRGDQKGDYIEPSFVDLERVVTCRSSWPYVKSLLLAAREHAALLPVSLALFLRYLSEFLCFPLKKIKNIMR